MASSRTERIGTIFSRITSLWKNNALTTENLPLWYEVYKAFPPKYEPRFDRPKSDAPIRNIFYEEDRIRVQFGKDIDLPIRNLNSKEMTRTEQFCIICKQLKENNYTDKEIYEKALQMLKKQHGKKLEKM